MTQTTPHTDRAEQTTDDTALEWLSSEFPEWDFEVGTTETWSKGEVTLWIARQEGHHPQAELTAGKLYSRLSDYLERERARHGFDPDSN